MDPDALWKMILEGFAELQKGGNVDTRLHVKDCLEQLGMWIYRGGFPPDVMKSCAQMVAHEVLNNPLFKEEL